MRGLLPRSFSEHLTTSDNVMPDTATISKLPHSMEFRETARRFLWLCVVLAVIWLVVLLAHEPAQRFIEQQKETVRNPSAAVGLIAGR